MCQVKPESYEIGYEESMSLLLFQQAQDYTI